MKQAKRIYDSIHGFIYLNEWENQLIDSAPFQRLHYIRQLGCAYLVYPGAVHSRFEHSLGVMKLASEIFDKLKEKETLFSDIAILPYWRQMIRLAALVHDLGHLPFSHSAEKALLDHGGHEKWTLAVIRSDELKPLWEELQAAYPDQNPLEAVIKIAIGASKLRQIGEGGYTFSDWETVLSEMITGDFFGADRIDYLLRDAKYTGLSYGFFDYHQLIEMLVILPKENQGGWILGVEENGIESCEALLLARHFMYRRIYEYPSIKAYAFHLTRFMEKEYGRSDFRGDVESYLSLTDNEVLSQLACAAKDETHPGYVDARAFLMRKKRFKASPLTERSNEELIGLKKTFQLSEDQIYWEFSKNKKGKMGLHFPVLLKNDSIVPAVSLSELLIPAGPQGWLYVDPQIPVEI